VATPYRNILMSMAWRFDGGPGVLAGLSLAAGVAVLRALNDYAVSDIRLKWPNDLLWDGRKLGGLLVDIRGEAAGPCTAVLGLGLNVQLAAHDAAAIDQPWADLHGILGRTVDRNRLAALLIRHAQNMFRTFESSGLAAFRREWEAGHHYAGKRIRLLRTDGSCEGVVHGVDDSGALLIRNDAGQLERFHSGEISLRPPATGAQRGTGT
jgi:BirA family biotin operon repressor/biotin-[acetyl-CoA-carboxylase] ligase